MILFVINLAFLAAYSTFLVSSIRRNAPSFIIGLHLALTFAGMVLAAKSWFVA